MEKLRAKWIKKMYASYSLAQIEEPNIDELVVKSFPDTIDPIKRQAHAKGREEALYDVLAETEGYNERFTKIQQELHTIVQEAKREEQAALESEDMESAYAELTKKQMAQQFLDKIKLLEVQT